MILKINNMLDAELLKSELDLLPICVQNAIEERLETLVEAYGNFRLESKFGGVVIYIITETTGNSAGMIDKILHFYNIDNGDELYEYSEIIGENHNNDEVIYTETLYLLGNGETSLLIFCAFK